MIFPGSCHENNDQHEVHAADGGRSLIGFRSWDADKISHYKFKINNNINNLYYIFSHYSVVFTDILAPPAEQLLILCPSPASITSRPTCPSGT